MNRRDALAALAVSTASLRREAWGNGSGPHPAFAFDHEDIARLLRLSAVPSIAFAVVDKNGVKSQAVGVLRVGAPGLATADTPYQAASLTKAVVAYTALSLVREGAFSLDRPVLDYLPLPNADDERARRITARHLLSHSSGWRNWRFNATQPLVSEFEPGSRWSYSGEGFFFLQRLMEQVTNRAMGELVRERVFAPLGMSESSMLPPSEPGAAFAIGHDGSQLPVVDRTRDFRAALERRLRERGARPDQARVEDAESAAREPRGDAPALPVMLSPNAAASLVTSANEFARFLHHLLTAREQGGAPAAIVADMFAPQVTCNEAISWGLGVGLEASNGSHSAWQWGDNPGFKNFFFADRARGVAMVAFTNGDRGARVYQRVIQSTTGEDRAAFLFA